MSPPTRRAALTLLLAAPALAALPRAARAAEPPVFARGGTAIGGTDPVAYFEGAGPVAGSAAHAVDWMGATWHFASAGNATAFAADPARHAPQFGGYCAFAAARGYVAPTIPEAWTLHDGQLFLNASLRVRRRWLRDLQAEIDAGRANWPGILG